VGSGCATGDDILEADGEISPNDSFWTYEDVQKANKRMLKRLALNT